MSLTADPIIALKNLGLNGLEAEIYVHLLKNSPLTGYSVAKGIRKPVSNVYKALDTLAKKGAVEIEEGKTNLVRPVPYQELLHNLDTNFKKLRDTAEESLADLPGPDNDHRIYHLSTRNQVMAKCRTMLDGARSVVVADLFPESAELLRPEFERLVKRGATLIILAYTPFKLPGAIVQQMLDSPKILARWPAQWQNLVVDGEQSIISIFQSGSGDLIQAYWTSSPSLAYIHHSGIISEIGFTALQEDIENGRTLAEMKKSIRKIAGFMGGKSIPGFENLIKNLGLKPSQNKS